MTAPEWIGFALAAIVVLVFLATEFDRRYDAARSPSVRATPLTDEERAELASIATVAQRCVDDARDSEGRRL